jgi:hypothetical protein
MATFEEDRKLVTYTLVLRVLQAENFLDRGLYDFVISGAHAVSTSSQGPPGGGTAHWLTDEMRADLKYLSGLKPFSVQNLLNHIANNPNMWSEYRARRDRPLTFQDLPNKGLLDMRFFTRLDSEELLEGTGHAHHDGLTQAPDSLSQ